MLRKFTNVNDETKFKANAELQRFFNPKKVFFEKKLRVKKAKQIKAAKNFDKEVY